MLKWAVSGSPQQRLRQESVSKGEGARRLPARPPSLSHGLPQHLNHGTESSGSLLSGKEEWLPSLSEILKVLRDRTHSSD